MIKISDSKYSQYFENFPSASLDAVFLLDSNEMSELWSKVTTGKGKSFYDTTLSEVFINARSKIIGHWIDGFNGSLCSRSTTDLLVSFSNWSPDTHLFFIKDSKNGFFLNFRDFLTNWINFLSIFDDGPLLISSNISSKAAFRFAPIGTILFYSSKID
jgi:hypothetical protein